jgi:menaquinone-dependent protoporphyrinogen IX oxidase
MITWKQNGKSIRAIFGIDLLGTSKQALEFALNNFDQVLITHSTSYATFHPKFYLFYGDQHAIARGDA